MKKLFLIFSLLTVSLTSFADENQPKEIELTADERQLVENNNNFALSLFRKARAAKKSPESMILSPLSITIDLGMLNNGADGITREEIDAVLGSKNVGGAETINKFCRKLLDESGTLDEKTRVAIANNIYVNKASGCELLPAFVETAKNYYDATPESRDFGDGVTRDVINKWGADHTEGMIEEAIKEHEFNPDAVSYLLNALYFKGEWTHKFNAAETQRHDFDGGLSEAQMMHQESDFSYTENDVYQSVILPYGNMAYQMTVFLPRKDKTIDDVINELETNGYRKYGYDPCQVNLYLPRFETETDIHLEDIMKDLGMPNAFAGGYGFNDFCNTYVYIGMMKQVAKIKLDEEGTEAAAVTVIEMDKGMSGPRYADFIADRPFLYIISEQSTGAIFFMGQYMGEKAEVKKNELEKPMLVEGKTWHYIYHHFEDKAEPTGYNYPEDFYDETLYDVAYKVQGDTIIEGRKYMKMYRSYDYGRFTYYGAFREDENGRVWQYNLMGDKQDFMLCDVTCTGYPELWEKTNSIADVIKVNGQLLHRYHMNGLIGVEGVGMEGKGLIHYLFGEEPDCICDYESFSYVSGGGIYFTAADFRTPKYIQLTDEEKQLVKNNNDFAFSLFREARNSQLSTLNSQPSMLLSPLSITYALGMANNGANGQTQQEICNVLGFGNVDAQNEFCLKMIDELALAATFDTTTKTSIANTIFVNRGMGYQLQNDFKRKASNYYYAHPEERDFADGETREVINQWASDHTEGVIKEVLSEPESNPLAVSYLLNAIYFKGIWSSPFNAKNTKEEPFADGEPVPMMHQEIELQYDENDLYQTVVMPYGNGTYQMQVFLPREGKTLDELVESLASNFPTTQLPSYPIDVDLKLPRFDTSTNINLKDIMSALGMPTAFSPTEADFSKLCVDNFGNNIYIGMMKQVAKIEVNEEGTEAAAVTIIGYATTGMPKTATFHADRPFLYVITEQSTGIILFMGQYLGSTTTAIQPVEYVASESQQTKPAIYSLSGQRLSQIPAKGLYIQNGRKVVR